MAKNRGILGAIIALAGLIGYIIFHWGCPTYYPAWYWLIPVFWFCNACLFAWLMSPKKKGDFLMQKSFILKIPKILGSLLILIFYFIFVKENTLSFLITMVIFYLIYTVSETYFLLQLNKKENTAK